MINQEKFDALSKDMEEVLKKHNVEIIIRSELSFKEIETNGNQNEEQPEESPKAD